MADDDRVTVMQIEEENDQFSENPTKTEKNKKTRVRKTKEEKIKAIQDRKEILRKKYAQLEAEEQKLSLTPEEKKAEKRKAENHCKIIAGVTALDLAKNGQNLFTLENFKIRLYLELTNPLEKDFLDKVFKETKNN